MESLENPEFGITVINNFLKMFILPEVERRRADGRIKDQFQIIAAQVIFSLTKGPEIRLNEEVKAVASVKTKKQHTTVGELVMLHEIESMTEIELTDEDPDSGHFTVIFTTERVFSAFNFKYNATRVAQTIGAAIEFLELAQYALNKDKIRGFVENLWSASELLAKAFLLWTPDHRLLESKKHNYIRSEFNRAGGLGNADFRWVRLLNEITELRNPARYLDGPLPLSETRAKEMLADGFDLLEYIKTHNPVRHRSSELVAISGPGK